MLLYNNVLPNCDNSLAGDLLGQLLLTVNLAKRPLHLLTDHIDLLRKALCDVRLRHQLKIEANGHPLTHAHAGTLAEGDANCARRSR